MDKNNTSTILSLCEYTANPFEDCFCREVTGRTVPMIARLCMDNYTDCPIYQKYKDSRTEAGVLPER